MIETSELLNVSDNNIVPSLKCLLATIGPNANMVIYLIATSSLLYTVYVLCITCCIYMYMYLHCVWMLCVDRRVHTTVKERLSDSDKLLNLIKAM